MASLFRTVTAAVTTRTLAGRNGLGEAVYEETVTDVPGVMVAPGSTADLDASRPEGASVALTLHWPRAALGVALKGAAVELPAPWAGTYRVVGDPKPYDPAMVPPGIPFCMPVEVEEVDA